MEEREASRLAEAGYSAEEMPSVDGELTDDAFVTTEIDAFHVNDGEASKRGLGIGERFRNTVKKGAGLILIGGGRRGPSLRDGYLAVDVPPSLRFSDVDPVNSRPPSPALPEFNFVSNEYVPYLIEDALPEDAMNDASLLSEIVIELEPHEIVSGVIDTRRTVQEELVEHFDLEEQRNTVLRPEEVLIFFETDSNLSGSGAMVPFSPATPTTNTTIKSSATLKKE